MKKYTKIQYFLLVISIFLCIIPHFLNLPTSLPEGGGPILTESGATVLCTLVAAVIMWLFVDVDWTSFIIMISIAMVPELGMAGVIKGSFGHDICWYLMCCFMLAASLINTGVARRIAVFIMTCKFGRKGPWYTIGMMFVSIILISSFLSTSSAVMVFLPILYEIFNILQYKTEDNDKFTALMMASLIIVVGIGQSTSPISHSYTTLGFATYATYVGKEIGFLQYVGVALPIAIICIIVWFLICKFVFRPDVSRMVNLDYEKIRSGLGPMKKEEKIAIGVYVAVIVLWVLPGVAQYASPELYSVVKNIQQCIPPMLALVVLHLWKVDGKPVLDFKDALKATPLSTYVFIAAMLLLNSCFSNTAIGLPDYLAHVMGIVFDGVPATVFFIAIVVLAAVLTNFISNAVTVSVAMTVAMPLCLTLFAESINPMLVAVMISICINWAFATASATPPCAILQDSGWISSGRMFKYGMIALVVFLIIGFLIGPALGGMLLV